ncbi:hypothetical protein DFR70_103266 [Nocardia tenerifensis]|uniref:Excreted virulence factor EspC (Type VII ESX diderm) n=1 Tax=Nocardia tenerifensis TaxID=228006 RepID=A0A318KSQ7_9NOCA|nr:hypothetical protein [Nocardia tenerifensis]PXX66517.1 hypothetical protein DFR70_103266 [Nocardia tenerifensis]
MTGDPSGMVGVQTGELGRLAGDLRVSGQAVAKRSKDVTDNEFGPADAGEHYAEHGKKIQQGFERIAHWMESWAEATITTADALGASVVLYSDTVRETAGDIARVGREIQN